MKFPIPPTGSLIIVRALIKGPAKSRIMLFALDTGASQTVISPELLSDMGYDLSQQLPKANIMTESKVEAVSLLTLESITCLGQVKDNFSIIVFQLPPSSRIEGLLGLDFLRGHVLTLDFARSEIELL